MKRRLTWLLPAWLLPAALCATHGRPASALPPPGLKDVPISRKGDKGKRRRRPRPRRDLLAIHKIRSLKRRIAFLQARMPALKAQVAALGRESGRTLAHQARKGRQLRRKITEIQRITGRRPIPTLAALARYKGPELLVDSYRSASHRRLSGNPNGALVNGDRFFIHMKVTLPRPMAAQGTPMRFIWRIKGLNHAGHEVTVAERKLFSGRFVPVRHAQAVLNSEVRGLGLTPGVYTVKASMEVKGHSHLKRTRHHSFRVDRVQRLVTAPPLKRWRVIRKQALLTTRASRRTPGARRLRHSDFVVYVGYRVDGQHHRPGLRSVVGAYVLAENATSRTEEPLVTLFRHWDRPRRGPNTFGSPQLTRVRGLARRLKPGRYKIRVYAAIASQRVTIWSYRDLPLKIRTRGSR